MKKHAESKPMWRSLRRNQAGATLIEILITMVIMAFGLLGLAGFVTKSTAVTADTAQRARASALLSDMTGRLANNKTNAATYIVAPADPFGTEVQDCAALSGAALDLCEWNNLLAGSNDAQPGGNASALGYRGCITQPVALDENYVITVAWGAITEGVPPADLCAQSIFGAGDTYRRVLRAQIRVPTLS